MASARGAERLAVGAVGWRFGLALLVKTVELGDPVVYHRDFRDSTEGENIPRGPAEC